MAALLWLFSFCGVCVCVCFCSDAVFNSIQGEDFASKIY